MSKRQDAEIQYTLWDRPSTLWSPLNAGAPLTKAELDQVKKEIEAAREEERKKNPWLGVDLPVKNPHKRYGAVL